MQSCVILTFATDYVRIVGFQAYFLLQSCGKMAVYFDMGALYALQLSYVLILFCFDSSSPLPLAKGLKAISMQFKCWKLKINAQFRSLFPLGSGPAYLASAYSPTKPLSCRFSPTFCFFSATQPSPPQAQVNVYISRSSIKLHH